MKVKARISNTVRKRLNMMIEAGNNLVVATEVGCYGQQPCLIMANVESITKIDNRTKTFYAELTLTNNAKVRVEDMELQPEFTLVQNNPYYEHFALNGVMCEYNLHNVSYSQMKYLNII